jgi:serine/threonine protein kinase
MIAFLCSGCGKSLKVKDEFAGRSGRCPHCQKQMTVPSADAARDNEGTETDAKTILPANLDAQLDSKTILPAMPRGNSGVRKGNTAIPTAPSAANNAELYDFLSPAQEKDEMGRLGNYRVLKILGAGGMGVVFQAEDPKLHRLVALKAMLPALAASPSNKERFLLEARAAAAVEHDHIIPIFEVNEDRGVPFIAMPFLRGESLEDRLKKQRKLPLEETLRITKECAEGLAAAHERNLIHRDIKPANIWLEGEKGRVKILDFGLARSAGGESNLTQQGAIIGTPAYMAPEQGAGKKVDTRCDLFSLGCVFYRLATGTLPFKAADTVSTLVAVATETPTAPRKLNPNLPPRASKLIMDLLAKSPEDRPPSALSVVDLIDEIQKEPQEDVVEVIEEPAARRSTVRAGDDTVRGRAYDDEEMETPAKRSLMMPLLIGGGVGALALIVAGVIGLIVLLKKDDKPEVVQNKPPVVENNLQKTKPVHVNPTPTPDNTKKSGGNPPSDNKSSTKTPPKEDDPSDPIETRPNLKPKKNAKGADKTYNAYTSAVNGLLFAPDGKHFFSFAENKSAVNYWELDTGKILRTFNLGATVRQFLISSEGSRLIAYNSGGLLCWDVDGGQVLVTVVPLPGMTIVGGGFTDKKDVRAALNAKAPGGSLVFIYDHGLGNLLPLIDPKTKKSAVDKKTKKPVPQPFPHPNTEVTRVFFSPDAKRFITWSADRMFRLWDAEPLRLIGTSSLASGDAKSLDVSKDFKRLVGAFGEPEFHVYDVEEGKEVKDIKPDGVGNTEAVAFGGASKIGIAARFGGPTCIYDLEDGTVKTEIKGVNFTRAIALSPDGKTVLCGDIFGKIYVFKIKE